MRWYDVLVHLEETPDGMRMKELAERILYSKSGFTRVVDRHGRGGTRPARPTGNDRRSILVVLTEAGTRRWSAPAATTGTASSGTSRSHLTDADIKALTRALEKLSAHARPLRPGRIRD